MSNLGKTRLTPEEFKQVYINLSEDEKIIMEEVISRFFVLRQTEKFIVSVEEEENNE